MLIAPTTLLLAVALHKAPEQPLSACHALQLSHAENFVYAALSPHPNGFAFWSKSDSLFYRDPPQDHPNGVYWSRGNGWVAAALVQALKYAPPSDPHTQTYRLVYRQHMARLAELQGADGCWRSSLTNPGALMFEAVKQLQSTVLCCSITGPKRLPPLILQGC